MLGLILLAMMLVGAFLEMAGIASIPAYIAVLSNPEVIDDYPTVAKIVSDLAINTSEKMALFAGIGIIVIYVIKNSFLALLRYAQQRYSFGREVSIASRLFHAYMLSPYAFHLQRNSAESIRNITGEVSLVISRGIFPIQNIIKETVMLAGILGLLVFAEPTATAIVVVILGGSGTLFFLLVRRKLSTLAQASQTYSRDKLKGLYEGLRGIKDVRVLGREMYFWRRFNEAAGSQARVARFGQFIVALPPLFIETAGVVVLLTVTIFLVQQGRPTESLIPTLALFGVAGFRLMPIFNRLLMAMSSIRSGLPSVKVIYDDLRLLESVKLASSGKSPSEFEREPSSIKVENVSFRYESSSTWVLKDINLEIPKGHSVAFVGHTGSGKTTLVDIILGLLSASKGRILADGSEIGNDIRAWQNRIGYIPQSIYLTDDTIRRNVAFGVRDEQIDDAQVWVALELAQLKEFVRGLQEGLETFVGEGGVRISGGQRQRIGIARALYHNPTVLIMDEATSALDTETERLIVESINRLRSNRTIIVIAHRLSTVKGCDRLFFLKEGRIEASGSFEDLRLLHEDFAAMAS